MKTHLRLGDVGRLLFAWFSTSVALALAAALLPGLEVTTWWSFPAAAAATAVAGLALRPVMVAVSAWVGWIAVLPLALVGQAIVLNIGLRVVPGITADSFATEVLASWIAAFVGTVAVWLTTAGTDDALAASLLRRRAPNQVTEDPDVDGVVFVQIDGVPYPVLRWAIQAGSVPAIRSWVTSGEYVLREWTPQLPCTTPASQLGILHGTVAGIPAFRWYDRELGRVLVANRPQDAALIEERASNGRGLLADGGISVSNLFTGDAPRSAMTMSRLKVARGSEVTRRTVAWFLIRPDGFARSLTRTIAEIVKERFQARRQQRRSLQPRVHRGWTFAFLRAVTNGVLRDLNTAVVAMEMRQGTKSIYVDYVDYDEIAHHAGMFRPESLASLDGLDRVLNTLRTVAQHTPRRYHLVVLSDHGQSQGRTFLDRRGTDLASLCAELTAESVQSIDNDVEGWGRAESVLGDLSGGSGMTAKVASKAEARVMTHVDSDGASNGGTNPNRNGNGNGNGNGRDAAASAQPLPGSDLTVLGSGNLGLLYQRGERRMTLEEITRRWPRLVPGLVAEEHIGFVAAIDGRGHAVALGRAGRADLTDGSVEGEHPLIDFPEHAARVLERAILMDKSPDLYVNSAIDPGTSDVAAFEQLVGSHGGLGGWQDRAVLLCPTELLNSHEGTIEGADELHLFLVSILDRLGHRRSLV